MSFLDELFGQILQSEEKIKLRFDQLKDAHTQILDLQSQMKDGEFDLQSHRGTMAVKTQKLVKKEIELKWLLAREEILQLQIKKTRTMKDDVINEKTKLQEQLLLERNKFFEEAKQFAKKYELPSNSEREYDKQLSSEIKTLEQEKNDLLAELQAVNCHLEKTELQKDRIKQINKSVLEMLLDRDEKQEILKKSCNDTSLAFTSKEEIAKQPQTNLEFKRIAEALNACQSKSIELNKQRQDLLSVLYHTQQQFMKAESKRKTSIIQQKGQAETITKENNMKGRVNLFKSVYPSGK